MNDDELKHLWQSAHQKMDTLLAINKQQLHAMQTEKADSVIRSFMRNHAAVMLVGILWITFLAFFAYYGRHNVFFAGSLSIIALFNVFAVGLYLKHLIVLGDISENDSIAERQQKLVAVYKSYSQSGRVLLLQAPFYCTFWYTMDLWKNAGPLFWTIQFGVVFAFTFVSVFLFRQLSPDNPSDAWRKRSNRYFGAEKLRKAIDLLKQVQES